VPSLTNDKFAVCVLGLGDEMRAIKACVIEIANLLVVSKAGLTDTFAVRYGLGCAVLSGGTDHDRGLIALKVNCRAGLVRHPLISLTEPPSQTNMSIVQLSDQKTFG